MQADPKAKPHMMKAAMMAEKVEPILYEVKSAQGKIKTVGRVPADRS